MSKTKQKGSSLIEVLVTLTIMAVGLLGLASMQMISLKNINNSQFRTLATAYAYDMAERMRANREGVEDGNYDAIDTSTAVDPGCGTASSCSVAELAKSDAFKWSETITQGVVSGGLPTGGGSVTRVAGSNTYNIKISWVEQGRDNTGGTVGGVDFTLTVQL